MENAIVRKEVCIAGADESEKYFLSILEHDLLPPTRL